MSRLFWSTTFYTFCLAFLMVLSRLLIFDGPNFFSLAHIPNHDMYQGASFFTTNLHSMRLDGDLAWWNPAEGIGYAQYPQFFLSPVAPTANNIVFMIWMQTISLFAGLGIIIPEYGQYLAITYVVYPFLAFWAFASFVSLLFKHRLTIALVTILFVFSGAGFWYGTWFYFQEPATLFFFLYSLFLFLRQPKRNHALLLLIAALIQVVSVNYWTLYNSWFIGIIMISYGLTHPNQVKRSLSRAWRMVKRHMRWTIVLSAVLLLTLVFWALVIGSTVNELSYYGRTDPPFTVDIVYDRIFNFSNALSEMFSPFLVRGQAVQNYAHGSRYIGMLVIPFGIAFFCYRWRRLERFWFFTTVLLLTFVLAPPLLLRAWEYIPFMKDIRHQFYFYQQYVQLAFIIAAGFGIDHIQHLPLKRPGRFQLQHVFMGTALAGLAVVLYVNWLPLPSDLEQDYQTTLFGWLLLIYSVIAWLFVTQPRSRLTFSVALVVFTYQDMSRYFFEVSRADEAFTRDTRYSNLRYPYEITEEDKQSLEKPWNPPNLQLAFTAGLTTDNLPLSNSMWPRNDYIRSRQLTDLMTYTNLAFLRAQALEGNPLVYFGSENAEHVDIQGFIDGSNMSDQAQLAQRLPWTLLIDDDPEAIIADNSALISTTPSTRDTFDFQWLDWAYNENTIQVNMPQPGWVLIRELFSPNWALRVDGVPVKLTRAYGVDMATYLPAGIHTLTLDFRPLARNVYWVAVVALEFTLALLAYVAFRLRNAKY